MEKTDLQSTDKTVELDPSIIKKIQKIFIAMGNGNGIKEEEITFNNFAGRTVKFSTSTIITLRPLISKNIVAGKADLGKIIGSEQELETIVKNSSILVLKDKNTVKKVKDIILKREDRGFAIKNIKQKLNELKKQYCRHIPCQNCHASGKINCQYCRATGKITCPTCRGNRQIQCTYCNGSGMTQTPKGQIQCTKCMGRGRSDCFTCHATGQTRCKTCNATGKTGCQPCASTGWMTESVQIEQEATFVFHVNLDENNQDMMELAKTIEQNGANMLLKNDIRVNIIENPSETSTDKEAGLNDSQIAINYSVSLPYGDITYNIKNEEITSKLTGYRGKLTNTPPFMEKILKKPLINLKRAALAPSTQTLSLLEKACKARLIKEVIKLSAEESQRNALTALQHKYPYGFKENTLKSLIKMARKSFLDLTRGGRYKGLALGLVTATIISALYYFLARSQILQLVPQNQTTVTIIDTIAFAIGLTCNLLMVQTVGKKHLFKNLSYLLHQKIKVRANQVNTGKAWIWSLIGNIIVFIGLSWIAFILGFTNTAPIWLNL